MSARHRLSGLMLLGSLVMGCGSGGPTGPNNIVIAVSPTARSASVIVGQVAPGDSATVSMAGPRADSTFWVAAKKSSWLVLVNINGKGSGQLAWLREASGLAVGTYVDTITVTVVGSATTTARIVDTLHVLPLPPPTGPFAISPSTVATGGTVTVTSSDFRLRGTAVFLQFEDTAVPMTRIGPTEFTAQIPANLPAGVYHPLLLLDEFSFVLDQVTVVAAGGLRNP
jgi:hypothetical protein